MKTKVVLLHNRDCHVWQTLPPIIEEAMEEVDLKPNYEIIMIDRPEDAANYHFFGSPQITIDGEDLDERARGLTNFHVDGCRSYLWQGRAFDYPPKEMIREALKKKMVNSG